MFSIGLSLTGRLKSSGFSPISLFSAGEQGVWYEPSDLTTMFQDRAGTTPVTTPGQTVGLRLDKSKGLVLGSELRGTGVVSTLGSPGTLATFNTSTGAGSAYRLDGSNASAVQIPAADGRTYLIDVEQLTGSLQIRGTSPAGTILVTSVVGRQTYRILVGGSEDLFFTTGANASSVTFTVHSVKELPGNHAVAPTDAARPTYGIEPKTGRRNVANGSADITNATYWPASVSGSNITGTRIGQGIDTDGLPYIDVRYTGTSVGVSHEAIYLFANSRVPAIVGESWTASAVIKWISGSLTGVSGIRIVSYEETAPSTFVGGSNGNFVTAATDTISTATRAISSGNQARCAVALVFSTATTIDVTFRVKGLQFERGTARTAYQFNYNSFNVTEAGVPTVHYVQYDGTDDSFSTSSIDFTATNKMSVFAGLRKLSDVLRGMAVEIGSGGANGSFAMEAPDNNGAITFAFRSIGTSAAVTSFAANAAPITRIVTGLGNIAAPSSIIRLDGVQVNQNTNTQGTGNYGNYPLYIGRRWNTSLPFNGRDYGIIVVGKTASASEIYSTESYLAANTSGVSI